MAVEFTAGLVRSMLAIDKHRLDDALEVHAQMQDRIAQQLARTTTTANIAKRDLEAEEGRIIGQLKIDDPKLSNTVAEKEVRRNSAYLKAWRLYQEARQEMDEWAGLLDAWKARGYNLKALADLYGMQYFAVDSTRARSSVADAVNRYRGEFEHRDGPPRRRRTANE